MRMKHFVMILLLLAMTAFADSSFAALLGVQPGLPQISFNIGSTTPATSYDPATGLFSVSAVPLSYRWSTTVAPVSVTGTKSLTLKAHLDNTGKLVPNVDGDELVMTGTITAAGQTYSGTLLTGKVTGFGFFNSTTTTDSFDFRLTTTGGLLQPQWAGKDIGITLASESSTFNGNFTVSFRGNAKGTVGVIPGPYMTLAESCTDAQGQEQPIEISATLMNTGTEALTHITCTSTPVAALAGVPTGLAPGESAVITGSYLPGGSPSTGSISCSGTGSGSLVTITTSSSATCKVVATPALSLTAACVDAPAPGGAITISATVTNTGNESLAGFSCSDSFGAALSGVPSTLAPGAIAVLTGSYVPNSSGFTDTVTCSAKGVLDGTVVSGKTGATCNIITNPALKIAETCADSPAPGQAITLSATITNAGNETLTALKCTDSNGASLAGVPATLTPGATASITGTYIPTASGSIDTISCSASGAINSDTVSASSSSTCNIITKPAIAVAATCTDALAPGQPINVSAVLSNTGNEQLNGITCTDSHGTPIDGVPATLPPGETSSLSASYIPTASGSTDTVTCSASGAINSATVSSLSSSTCNIITKPAMALSQSCTDASAPGQEINVSGVLSNTGNEPLKGITCSDSRGTTVAGVPTTLTPGAAVSLTTSYVPATSGSLDSITCTASGAINSGAVSADSSSTCNIVTKPALSVAASCSNAPAPGLPIAVSGVITNTGNEVLTGITCSDSKGAMLTGTPATLIPGASATLTGSYTPAGSPSTDTISCSATGAINSATVTGYSSSTCSVLNPAIKIVKYTNGVDAPAAPGPKIPLGGQVTWTYIVTNTGNVSLSNVTVTDDKVTSVTCPGNNLAVGASMTCTATGVAIAGQYENIGTATGSAGGVTVTSSYPSHYYGNTASGCTYTQGFWKNHPERWPTGSLLLGSMSYTKDELLTILQTSVQGNGLVSLAHQLIAAKLNLANGASLTPEVQNSISSADKMIGSMQVPPIGSGYLPTSDTSAMEATLDTYNSGLALTGPGHCDDVPALPCTGSVGNLVWTDVNGNGLQDAGEPGISGITVTLTNTLTGVTVTDTTDAGGYYMFTGVCAANYTVTAATPSGLLPSPSLQGNDRELDSNGSPTRVSLPTDSYNDNSVDFGFYQQACTGTIGDVIWNDQNANGIQDAGEPGIAGVSLALKNNLTGALVATTSSDDSGRYKFSAICAGSYTVTATTPTGYIVTPSVRGTDRSKDSNGSPASVVLTSNSSADLTVDFGYYRPVACTGSIGDFIWNDLNSNGIQDVGEPGLAGVAITLANLSSSATHTATSDANGRYSFTGLCSGSYQVTVQTPPAFSPSPGNQGSDRSKDSNVSPAQVTLATSSSSDNTIDFGFYKTPTPGQATGCSLGYWKEHPENWPTASRTTDNFDTVFGTRAFNPDINLLQSLNLGGGDLYKLARQGTAALLNAEDPRVTGFPITVKDLKAAIQNAISTGNYEPLATQLDNYNNLGCPLN